MRFFSCFFLACLFLGFNAIAEDSPIKPKTQGGIEFVSGGIGSDEQQAMDEVKGNYNLYVLLAIKGTGEFVSEANVKLIDASGKVVLETIVTGPKLYAKLPVGRYKIIADKNGHSVQQSINIPKNRSASVSLFWPEDTGN